MSSPAGPATRAYGPNSSPDTLTTPRKHEQDNTPATSKGKERANDDDGNPLTFDNISYYLSPSLRPDTMDVIRALINKNGGNEVVSTEVASNDNRDLMVGRLKLVDYIISDSWHLERDLLLNATANDAMEVDGEVVKDKMPDIVTVSIPLISTQSSI